MTDVKADQPSASITMRNQSSDMELVPVVEVFDTESLPQRKQKILRKGSPDVTSLDAGQKQVDEETK